MRTKEFELPFGYEGPDGKVHKTVVMRAIKNKDIISLGKDIRLKELARQDHSMSMNMVRAATAGSDYSGTLDPIKNQMNDAAIAELNIVLFSLVTLRIGDIEKPGRNIFEELCPADLIAMRNAYDELNSLIPEESEGVKERPLEQ